MEEDKAADVTGEATGDLVTRLRATDLLYNRGPHYEPLKCYPSELRLEAAREIERLRATTAATPPAADVTGEAGELFHLVHQLIQEAKGADGDQSYVVSHLDEAENWLDNLEEIFAATRPAASQGEVEKAQEAFSWAKKRVAEAQALQAQIDRLTKERDEARAQFDAHDELLHQCLDDRDAYRQRAIKGEAERDEATHTLDFVEKHLTARLEAAEAALASSQADTRTEDKE